MKQHISICVKQHISLKNKEYNRLQLLQLNRLDTIDLVLKLYNNNVLPISKSIRTCEVNRLTYRQFVG